MNETLFKIANTFKYPDVELIVNGDNHKEIQQKLNTANQCFFVIKPVFVIKTKIILYKIRLFVFYKRVRPRQLLKRINDKWLYSR